jgi:1,4-dihydroxy-2-naphthoate polyprenyltransferase
VTATEIGRTARWVAGARPRTLPASIVPVLVGAAAARPVPTLWGRLALCACVALALQVGTNYANDYSDGIRGTDARRVGPLRLVASGLATPSAVRAAALCAFAIAASAGLVLAALTSWWLLAVGVAAILAGWGYTGGPRPYGYQGLGELFVFVFFGLVATAGTTYCLTGRVTSLAVVAGASMGLLSCALLNANNLRDIDGDVQAHKRTIAVRLGRRRAGLVYVGLVAAGLACGTACALWRPAAPLVLVAAPLAIAPVRIVLGGATGPALLPVLARTSRLQLVAGLALVAGLWWSS